MSPQGRGRTRSRPKKILVFGESENDTKVIAELVSPLVEGAPVSIEPRRNPPVFIRDATARDIPDRSAKLALIVDAARVDTDVVAVIAHEDCDALDPAHMSVSQKIESALVGVGCPVVAATPAWEMEAWLMQWPSAFRQYRPTWRSIESYRGRNLGMIENVKEELIRALRPARGSSTRDYRESDAPLIAAIVRQNRWVESPEGRSDSYSSFLARTEAMLTTA